MEVSSGFVAFYYYNHRELESTHRDLLYRHAGEICNTCAMS